MINGEKSANPIQTNRIEELKSIDSERVVGFHLRLQNIVDRQLTVETIGNYGTTMVNGLVELIDEVVKEYKNNSNQNLPQTGKDIENEAFTAYGLNEVESILDRAQKKIDQIHEINQYIIESPELSTEVIVPPGGVRPNIKSGSYPFESSKFLPRLATLLYVLENDLGIAKENVSLLKGSNTEEMFRKESYIRVEIPDLERIVYICDEERNATYIFDKNVLRALNIDTERLDTSKKDEYKALISEFPGVGRRVVQSPNWRNIVEECLTSDFSEETKDSNLSVIDKPDDSYKVALSELDTWRNFWKAPDGRHWGASRQICVRLNIHTALLGSVLDKEKIESVNILDSHNIARKGYCFEEVEKLVAVTQLAESSRKVERQGEWEGFYIDDEGRHWGNIYNLERKLGFNFGADIIESINTDLKSISIRVKNNTRHEAYCYEDVCALKNIQAILQVPQVDKEGEWSGFWTSPSGQHIGLRKAIGERLALNIDAVGYLIETNPSLNKYKIRAQPGRVSIGHSFEEIAEILKARAK